MSAHQVIAVATQQRQVVAKDADVTPLPIEDEGQVRQGLRKSVQLRFPGFQVQSRLLPLTIGARNHDQQQGRQAADHAHIHPHQLMLILIGLFQVLGPLRLRSHGGLFDLVLCGGQAAGIDLVRMLQALILQIGQMRQGEAKLFQRRFERAWG